jgi:RimJ/RimL family protein N-acetyltransferase
MISIRRISLGEGDLFRDMRLRALQDSPQAFGSTYESALKRSTESWSEQADGSAEGSSRATFFLFEEDDPVGIIAFYEDSEIENQGEIIQLWVAPHLRGTGAAVKLTKAALEWAKLNNFSRAVSDVFEHNKRSCGLFLKLGFSPSNDPGLKRDGHILTKRLIVEPSAEPDGHTPAG